MECYRCGKGERDRKRRVNMSEETGRDRKRARKRNSKQKAQSLKPLKLSHT